MRIHYPSLLACGLSLIGCDAGSDKEQSTCTPPADCVDSQPNAGGAAPGDAPTAGATGDGAGQNPGGGAGQGVLPVGPPASQLDLLFVVDNSLGMEEKQERFARPAARLLERLVSPACLNPEGGQTAQPTSPDEPCPEGSTREFQPLQDIHVGVITTSLGGYGSPASCEARQGDERSEEGADMAHLLGSLPRASEASGGEAFLRWSPGADLAALTQRLQDTIISAGGAGCGYEATLESWYRFLADPYPYQSIVKLPCPEDATRTCIAPATDEQGSVLLDQTILQQRQQFLRPDSLLAIVMLSDENDCSFIPNGHSWQLAHSLLDDRTRINPAFRASASCEANPNDACCQSCGDPLLSGCPSEMDSNGSAVPAGCGASPIFDASMGINELDDINLRCFQQKRRFGVDYLYPTARYVNALRLTRICPSATNLDPAQCADAELVDNPLLVGRSASRIVLTGILGVPWQDLALDPSADQMTLRPATGPDGVNWDWIIGERHPADGIPKPLDPLMQESIAARGGTIPSTGEALAGPDAGYLANSINGHEWNITDSDTIQYACISPKLAEVSCPTQEERIDLVVQGVFVPACDCTWYNEAEYKNPVCQASDGSFSTTQSFDRAFPSLRQLQVLHDLGEDAVVGSVCTKQQPAEMDDYYYFPAMESLLNTLRGRLAK